MSKIKFYDCAKDEREELKAMSAALHDCASNLDWMGRTVSAEKAREAARDIQAEISFIEDEYHTEMWDREWVSV